MTPYDHERIESKQQRAWARKKIYKTSDKPKSGKKEYILDMFPYPSGEGLHVGHPKGYIATDVYSRMKRMQGFEVLHPMGFDAFGLPAENYAIKNKVNPEVAVKANVARYKKQLELLGLDYDWSREINTTDPAYYKWTQWIFLKMFEKGLAYESYEPINWCPSCKTGLANEDVEDGKCERCGTVVEKKPMRQWVLKITDYAERMLADLDAVDSCIPLIERTEGADAVKQGLPLEERNAAVAIVKHWSEDKYLCSFWKKNDWKGFVIGGVEAGEEAGTAAVREVAEETGYTSAKFVREVGKVRSRFYHAVKKVNRHANFTAVYLELSDGTRTEMAAEESALHDVVWLSRDEVEKSLNRDDMRYVWDLFTGKEKQQPKPLLDWPQSIKESQRNWIGKSEGAIFKFKVQSSKVKVEEEIEVFTTRPDTLFGVTYVVLAPEHKLVEELLHVADNKKAVIDYIASTKAKTTIERTDVKKEKTGVPIQGITAINPATGEAVPVWIADYALADYGTGAVMAVPAHDERDFAFAKKFGLPIKRVVIDDWNEKYLEGNVTFDTDNQYAHPAYLSEGWLVNSENFSGLRNEEAKKKITSKFGSQKTTYKLKDWVFSRQRYWGEPIPVIHCEKCGPVAVPEKDLPVKLPKVKFYEPTGTGESPLAAIEKWVNVKCPSCVAEKSKTKHIVFDFDGVLGDTWLANIESQVAMGEKTREDVIRDSTAYFSKKPEHTRNTTLSDKQMADYANWISRFGDEMAKSNFKLFEGFIKEVKELKKAKFAVVSAGSIKYVAPALKGCGVKFSHVMAYEDHHSKEEKIELIAADWGVSVKDVYYFTDTKADVYELENTLDRKKIIGCAWGYCGEQLLSEVLPRRQILSLFSDIHEYFNPTCRAKRETNTMPQWAGSSWYYLRYIDPKNKKALVDPKKEKFWSPVDFYVGGAEHATRHLIYARFWHKFLFDIGAVSTEEPFKKLQHVGLIMAEDGRKMSKRFNNVINPDDIVKRFGADTLRVYEMFMGPFDQSITWSTDNMVGSRRFIERVWKLADKVSKGAVLSTESDIELNKTIKIVGDHIASFRLNTAVSAMMVLVNAFEKETALPTEAYHKFLGLLAPFAPHVTDELWTATGGKSSIHRSTWPVYDTSKLQADTMTLAVMVNGKTRATVTISRDASEEAVRTAALALSEVTKWLEGKSPKKVIVVAGKVVSIVV